MNTTITTQTADRIAAISRDLHTLANDLEWMNSADVWSWLDNLATVAYLVGSDLGIDPDQLTPAREEDESDDD